MFLIFVLCVLLAFDFVIGVGGVGPFTSYLWIDLWIILLNCSQKIFCLSCLPEVSKGFQRIRGPRGSIRVQGVSKGNLKNKRFILCLVICFIMSCEGIRCCSTVIISLFWLNRIHHHTCFNLHVLSDLHGGSNCS